MKRPLMHSLAALALLVLLTLPRTALAGGVSVQLDQPASGIEAQAPFSFGFTIRSAHEGRQLISGLQPRIVATNQLSQAQVETLAEPQGPPGHYVATLTFPSVGPWEWHIYPFTNEHYQLALPGPLEVAARGSTTRDGAAAAPAGLTQQVAAADSVFETRELRITAGSRVTWTNIGKLPHAVTARSGLFASGTLEPGASFSYSFSTPGVYDYYCDYHSDGYRNGMLGRVIVTQAADTPQALNSTAQAAAALPATGAVGADAWPLVLTLTLALALALVVVGLRLRQRAGPH